MEKRPIFGAMSLGRRDSDRPFMESGMFKAMTRLGRSLGIRPIFFSPFAIHEDGRVHAYVYDIKTNRWIFKQTILPLVIYDRVFYPRGDLGRAALKRVKMMKTIRRDTLFLNATIKSKWQVYRALERFPEVNEYLPETRRLVRWDVLAQMLKKHKVVFIKPSFGSQGKGVVRIEYKGSGILAYSGRNRSNGLFHDQVSSLSELRQSMLPIIQGSPYLVQQGLELDYLGGLPFDLRCLVQKDGSGQWVVTGVAARIGKRGGVTSNLHGGGHAVSLRRILKQIFSDQIRAQQVIEEIQSMAILIATSLEESIGSFGEVALDIGLDVHGRLWLIEVNSKPGRKTFQLVGSRQTRVNTLLRPLEYARYLAGLALQRKGEEV